MKFAVDGTLYVASFEFSKLAIQLPNYAGPTDRHVTGCVISTDKEDSNNVVVARGSVTCDSRDHYVLEKGVKQAFKKAMGGMQLSRAQRGLVWSQYHHCCDPEIARIPPKIHEEVGGRKKKQGRHVSTTPGLAVEPVIGTA